MNKNYIICLSCGSVQIRTDIDNILYGKQYAFVDRKIMCPKCHRETQAVATKNVKQLRMALNKPTNKVENKINNYLRG